MNNVAIQNVKEGLCCGCGLCKHVCPFQNINMEYDEVVGRWNPVVRNEDICRHHCFGVCLQHCPTYRCAENEISNRNKLARELKGVFTGWSSIKTWREQSSSGGFVKLLSYCLLQEKKIDGIISLRQEHEDMYYPYLYQNTAEVKKMPNSIYHQVNFERMFSILSEHPGKYLIIGCPCHIKALNNYLSIPRNKKYATRVYAKVSLICGGTFERCLRDAFCYYKGMPDGKVISYRNGQRYRKTKVCYQGKEYFYDIMNPKSLCEDIDNWILMDKSMTQKACLYCTDHLGSKADIVVGDAWLKRYSADDIGSNVLLVRSEMGNRLVNYIKQTGKYHIETASLDDVEESQSMRYTYGLVGYYMRNYHKKDRKIPSVLVSMLNMEDIRLIGRKNRVKQLIIVKKYRKAKCLYCWQEKKAILITCLKKIYFCILLKRFIDKYIKKVV